MKNNLDQQSRTILLVGASRGLGQAMAAEFVKKEWQIVGTVREGRRAELDGLAQAHPDQVTIEQLDITEADQIVALDRVRQRGGICGVVEVVMDHAAMVAIVVGTASMVGGMSSAMASVCM